MTARQKALDLISYSEQSSQKIIRKLTQKGFPLAEAEGAVETLAAQGLIDDRRCAEGYLRKYWRKSFGLQRMRCELYGQGFPKALIQELLTPLEENVDGAEHWARKLRDQGKTPDKVYTALIRRGFSSSVARLYSQAPPE